MSKKGPGLNAIFIKYRYHSMDRRLARHMFSVGHEHIPFPPVAGYAGITNIFTTRLTSRLLAKLSIKSNILTGIAHLYKKGTRHTEEPWNWTGWVARWKRRTMWDPTDNRRKFVNNRYFMALRGNEVSQISKNFQVTTRVVSKI